MNTQNKGLLLALSTALISGFAVFMNKFAVGFWESSSLFASAKIIVVSILFTCTIILLHKLPELKALGKKDWLKLTAIGLIGGSIPFLLFFKGLEFLLQVLRE